MHRSTARRLAAVAGLVALGACAFGFADPAPTPAPPAAPAAPGAPAAPAAPAKKVAPLNLTVSVEAKLAERIAKELVAASPVVDPGDIALRDEAAEKIANCRDLMTAAGDRMLWGGFNPDQGYDPGAYRLTVTSNLDYAQLTEFTPVAWAKMYLSTFMFTGPYEVRKEGRFTVLEMDAKFRDALPPGDYPYPFWHSPNKWTAYVNVQKIVFIFEPGKLVASMRKSPRPESIKQIRRPWDAQWTWTDDKGQAQPRVALYDYLFSKDNPHVSALDTSFRELESEFRTHNCMTCHSPDNRSRLNELLLLNYPNQALIMRKTIRAVIEENLMPPGNALAHEPEGLQDKDLIKKLSKLAREFESAADKALAFEREKTAKMQDEAKNSRSQAN